MSNWLAIIEPHRRYAMRDLMRSDRPNAVADPQAMQVMQSALPAYLLHASISF
jgi:hypothetical protein